MKKILVTLVLSMYAVILFAAPQAVQVESSISGYMAADGTVLAGGTVEFFTSDSLSTEKDVYLDAQKADIITQPITLNDSGQPVSGGTNPIVIFADGTYWVRLKDSAGVVVNTPPSLTYGDTSGTSSDLDIAVLYGTTDTAITNAISDYTGGDEVTFIFNASEFTSTTARTWPTNIKLLFKNGAYLTNSAAQIFSGNDIDLRKDCYIDSSAAINITGNITFGEDAYIDNEATTTFNDAYINASNGDYIFKGTGRYDGSISNYEIYPEWYGAIVNDGVDDSGAFNKMFWYGSDVLCYRINLRDGAYTFSDKVYQLANTKVIGMTQGQFSTTQVIGTQFEIATSLTSDFFWVYNYNSLTSTINVSYNHASGLFKNIYIDTVGHVVVNNYGIDSWGALELENIQMYYLASLIKYNDSLVFKDLVKMSKIEATTIMYPSSRYIIDLGVTNGDAIKLSQLSINDFTNVTLNAVRVTSCNVLTIEDSILNGTIEISNCAAFSLNRIHMENQNRLYNYPKINIKGSFGSIVDLYAFKNVTGETIDIDRDDDDAGTTLRESQVSLKDCLFNIFGNRYVSSSTFAADILVTDNVMLKINNCYRIRNNDRYSNFKQFDGISVSGNANFNQYSYAYSNNSVLRNGYVYSDFDYADWDQGTDVISSIDNSIGFTDWRIATGNYYYNAITAYDTTRRIGQRVPTEEVSIALTNGGNGAELRTSLTGLDNGAIIQIYRGTESRKYDNEVSVHGIAKTRMFDDGYSVDDWNWESRSVSTDVGDFNDASRFRVNGENVETWLSDKPIAGYWTINDEIHYSGIDIRCVGTGYAYKEIFRAGTAYVTGNYIYDSANAKVYLNIAATASAVEAPADVASSWSLIGDDATFANGRYDYEYIVGTANYFADTNPANLLLGDLASGNVTINIPASTEVARGHEYYIQLVNPSGTNQITVTSDSTIIGQEVVSKNGQALHLINNGVQWMSFFGKQGI